MFTYINLPWIRHGYCNFAGNHHDQSSFGTPTDTQSTRQCGVLNDFHFLRNKMGLKKTVGKNPRGSMYGIFTYIYLICMVNVGKYTSPMDPLGMEQQQMGKCWKTIGTNILWNVWKIVLYLEERNIFFWNIHLESWCHPYIGSKTFPWRKLMTIPLEIVTNLEFPLSTWAKNIHDTTRPYQKENEIESPAMSWWCFRNPQKSGVNSW